jgi:hypothetical protein
MDDLAVAAIDFQDFWWQDEVVLAMYNPKKHFVDGYLGSR